MPLRKEPYSFPRLTSETFRTLPGLFADSLPDKFGRKVINEYLISIGRDIILTGFSIILTENLTNLTDLTVILTGFLTDCPPWPNVRPLHT